MSFVEFLEAVVQGEKFSASQAQDCMRLILQGDASEIQVAAFLAAQRARGYHPPEIAGFALALREQCVAVDTEIEGLVDTCGTGGGSNSFNISTAAAIVAAAAGARVAKHGNRAVTSHCGSADVLEALGIRLATDPDMARKQLDKVGITFLFAPHFHPAFKMVGPVRKALGIRTAFNLLGPLLNPARARRQVIGVFEPGLTGVLAFALQELGTDRAVVVHGEDGLDEVSPTNRTWMTVVEKDRVSVPVYDLDSFGMSEISVANTASGSTIEENAEILQLALGGKDPSRAEAIVPSASVALWAAGRVDSVREGADLAREVISSGAAADRLAAWRDVSNQ